MPQRRGKENQFSAEEHGENGGGNASARAGRASRKILQTQMAPGEGVAGTALQVSFKLPGQIHGFKGGIEFHLPRSELGGVFAVAGMVFRPPPFQVCRVTAISLLRLRNALQDVGVKHGLGLAI